MLSEIWVYLGEVVWGWLSVMGGVLATLLAFYERVVKKEELHLRRYAVVLAGFVLVAGFMAWRDKQHAVTRLNQDLETSKQELANTKRAAEDDKRKRNALKFAPTIDVVSTGYDPDMRAGQVFLLVAIRNLGEPSIAENFYLQIKSNRLDIVKKIPSFIEPGHKLKEGSNVLAVFGPDDNIAEKTTKPIEHNGIVRGWLAFVIPEVSNVEDARKFYEVGTSYTVTFHDVTGNPWSASYAITGRPLTEPFRYPGATMPFKFKKKHSTVN